MNRQREQMDRRVDFIGLGVQKAATSWIFECLRAHPEIRGPVGVVNKELHFFNRNYYRGYLWYHRRFEFGDWKTGEYSTLYFPDANCPERIYRYNPEVKLLLSLRNPIERAFSQHRHEIMQNHLPPEFYPFEKALPQNPSYLEQGKYASHLERFLQFFPRRSLHIILFDDIMTDPQNCLRQIYKFLAVDETFSPPVMSKKQNVSQTFRSHGVERVVRTSSKMLRTWVGDSVVEGLKATKVPGLLKRLNAVKIDDSVVPRISPEMRQHLRELFADEIARLSELIGRDLSHWN
ncbi:hypothetical protein GF339_12405 [candidate division KSB3 bacterium]|uniref:Sulfotransferase domain-containing protein n=1 Tax=candidate division KSB3 bacterium TaxID=2044937 RepID=A0A9D5JWF6_9BACT|nr:hypothetical protein [candidate division KSB3 bacterium]MBD3325383.1 hypothetical protein [candidate division KSB3 bacterium]